LPPKIDTLEEVQASSELLDTLVEVKNAFSLIVDVGPEGIGGITNKWDLYYKVTGAEISPVEKKIGRI